MSATERSRNVAEMRVGLSGAVASSASMRRLEARLATAATLPVSTVSSSPSDTTTAAPGAALANFERGHSSSAAKPCAPTASTTSRRSRPASAAVRLWPSISIFAAGRNTKLMARPPRCLHAVTTRLAHQDVGDAAAERVVGFRQGDRTAIEAAPLAPGRRDRRVAGVELDRPDAGARPHRKAAQAADPRAGMIERRAVVFADSRLGADAGRLRPRIGRQPLAAQQASAS